MKKMMMNFSVFLGIAIMLTGCVIVPPFIPKALNENAKGITSVRATPYGCKVLGELDGMDEYNQTTQAPTLEKLRLSAMNDLRNNAVEVVNKSKRITLRIVEEKTSCFSQDGSCPANLKGNSIVRGIRITAQIFECGDKDK